MDARRFDALTRTLAGPAARRALLRWLPALALGRLGGLGAVAAAPPPGRPPGQGPDRPHPPQPGPGHGHGPTPVDCADPANQGKPCGQSVQPRGGTLRCCHGHCPDRRCLPTGYTGIRCATDADCGYGYDCCSRYGSCDPGERQCLCAPSEPETDCGSDVDCAAVGQICVCGACQ